MRHPSAEPPPWLWRRAEKSVLGAFEQIDAPLIAAFLDDLEKNRGSAARSRNLRLTAIRSFSRCAAFEAPIHSAQI